MWVVDLHEDVITTIQGERSLDFGQVCPHLHGDLPSWRKGDYKIVVGAIFSLRRHWGTYLSEDAIKHVLRAAEKTRELAEQFADDLMILETQKDLERCLASNRIGILLAYEGAYELTDVWLLRALYRIGVRILGLTWNVSNLWATGAGDPHDQGLTPFGRQMVEKASDLGFILDLAHASPKTYADVLEMDIRPPIVSHTGILKQPKKTRNISWDVTRRVMEKGGIVGVALARLFFEDEQMGFEDLVQTLTELLQAFPNGLAVGTDFFGFGKEDEIPGIERVEKIQDVVRALGQAGVSQKTLEAWTHENAIRYLQTHLPAT